MDAVRARAGSENLPVSRIISRAVEEYLRTGDMLAARKSVAENLRRALAPTGWEALHRERTTADADRD